MLPETLAKFNEVTINLQKLRGMMHKIEQEALIIIKKNNMISIANTSWNICKKYTRSKGTREIKSVMEKDWVDYLTCL